MMTFLRLIPVALFSLTALSLLTYQGIEIVHALTEYVRNK
ncbi:hypothetical protein J2S02_004319 [Metabacillus niabensis]|uniref:Uncharacterized protein n=1 Tax=Metabacillus niabensis TaxID=324854 RepID=A0ABT9Z7H6_9BACI|nr:hypothetical protein [Metabacillus niabensis]